MHSIDDRLDRQIVAALVLRLTDLRENVLARRRAALGHHLREIVDEIFAARDAAAHRGKGHRHADDADRRLHHVDEGLVDLLRLRPPWNAEKARRGEVERQLLDRRIEGEGLAAPSGDAVADAVVERGGIVAHRFGLERDRKRLARTEEKTSDTQSLMRNSYDGY